MTAIERFRLTPQLCALFRKNKVQSMYLIFRRGLKAKETLRFQNRVTSDQMLVDCGADDYPVAVQFIYAKDVSVNEDDRSASKADFENAIHTLFMFATEMIRYHEANMQKKGNDLVKEATCVVRKVPKRRIKELRTRDLVTA